MELMVEIQHQEHHEQGILLVVLQVVEAEQEVAEGGQVDLEKL